MKHLHTIFVAGAVSIVAATTASANFSFNNTRSTFTGSDGKAYDAVTFYAFNDGTGFTAGGSKLLAMDVTTVSSTVMRFQAGHANDSFTAPPAGSNTPTYYEADTGLDIVLGDTDSQIGTSGLEYTKFVLPIFGDSALVLIPRNPNPETTSLNGNDPIANYTNRKNFAVVGAGLGVANGIEANVGLGAAFATIVAETGATISISGRIAGDTGTAGPTITADGASMLSITAPGALVPYAYTASVTPEPATLASAALAGIFARRRRR